MFGLTNLGVVHTLISLAALGFGFHALIRHKEIALRTRSGRLYIWATALTCLTGLPIMQHGGFGKPHVLAIITLLALGAAALAEKRKLFGRWSPYLETVGYSATFFFSLIPGVVETTTRLPLGAPLIKDREGPELQAAMGVLFFLFLVGATVQVLRLRALKQESGCLYPRFQSNN